MTPSPSGHATAAAAFFGAVPTWPAIRRLVRILAVTSILLVGLALASTAALLSTVHDEPALKQDLAPER